MGQPSQHIPVIPAHCEAEARRHEFDTSWAYIMSSRLPELYSKILSKKQNATQSLLGFTGFFFPVLWLYWSHLCFLTSSQKRIQDKFLFIVILEISLICIFFQTKTLRFQQKLFSFFCKLSNYVSYTKGVWRAESHWLLPGFLNVSCFYYYF